MLRSGFSAVLRRVMAARRSWRAGGAVAAAMLALPPLSPLAEPQFAVPTMTSDRIDAVDDHGHRLGTLVLPAIVAGRSPGPQSSRPKSPRPLLVAFNGGPGAASSWLELGLLGPWQLQDDGRLAPNRDGLWDRADILFVDPLGTGFSRADPAGAGAGQVDAIWSREGDGSYLARAIVAWMDRHHRRDAPVILIGESYGTERAVSVARHWLAAGTPIRLAGMALISQTVLSGQALDRAAHDATPPNLPTMAATACYWTGRNDPRACAEAAATVAGTGMSAGDGTLAAIGGPALARLAQRPGGLTLTGFRHLFHPHGLPALDRYDSRSAGAATPDAPDPVLAEMVATEAQAAHQNQRLTLGLDASPIDGSGYVVYDPAIGRRWRYPADPDLDRRQIADLGTVLHGRGAALLVAGGLFDTVATYAADRRLIGMLHLPPRQVSLVTSAAGHLVYRDAEARRQLLRTLRALLTLPPPRPMHLHGVDGKVAIGAQARSVSLSRKLAARWTRWSGISHTSATMV